MLSKIMKTQGLLYLVEETLNIEQSNRHNSDQGSHFASSKYIELFLTSGAIISIDHRGRAYDKIFIERFWRSLKYEDIYLKD